MSAASSQYLHQEQVLQVQRIITDHLKKVRRLAEEMLKIDRLAEEMLIDR
jgi:hypothetical protein